MMITAIASDPPTAAIGTTDFRNRLASGERSLLPTSTPPATPGEGAAEQRQDQPRLDADRSSLFVAAVITGALSPTPQSMEELIMRIGSTPIPAELQARIKDLLA